MTAAPKHTSEPQHVDEAAYQRHAAACVRALAGLNPDAIPALVFAAKQAQMVLAEHHVSTATDSDGYAEDFNNEDIIAADAALVVALTLLRGPNAPVEGEPDDAESERIRRQEHADYDNSRGVL